MSFVPKYGYVTCFVCGLQWCYQTKSGGVRKHRCRHDYNCMQVKVDGLSGPWCRKCLALWRKR